MRRALLTARAVPGLAFGNPAVAGTGSASQNNLIVDQNSACPGTGTLTTVNFYTTTAKTISVYVGSLSGSTFTIRSTADVTSDGSGLQSRTVSLPVVAGDRFAFWLPTPAAAAMAFLGVGSVGYAPSATKPTSGSFALTALSATYCMNFA